MPVHITHKMPDGTGVIETHVGERLAGFTAFESYAEAEAAGWSMLADHPNLGLVLASEACRAEIAAENPYAKYAQMSTLRLTFEAIRSIRFRMR